MADAIDYEGLDHFGTDFPNAPEDPKNRVRIAQVGAYNCVIQKIVVEKKLSCSVFLPTGVGKSDLVRCISLGMSTRGFIGVWAFSPGITLRDQLKGEESDKDDIIQFFKRIGEPNPAIKPFVNETRLDTPRFRNESVLESFTIQFLTSSSKNAHGKTVSNVDLFIESALLIKQKTGKLPVAVFDESHMLSTDNTWGSAATKLQAIGIPIVLVTGTPFRSDDIAIPGFETILNEEYERKFTKTSRTDDPNVLLVKTGTLKASKYILKADYEFTYSRSWDLGYILKPEPKFVDATEVEYEKMLSEMSKVQGTRIIRNFLMDEKTIKACVAESIRSIKKRKATNSKSACIVTTLSDTDEFVSIDAESSEEDISADIHANKIAREFARQSPELKVLVVTSNVNSKEGLNRFKQDETYDVLIVKAMGTVGFNCPRIKTVLNMSNHRAMPAFIQTINRGNRTYSDHSTFDVIMPKDRGMVELWNNFLDETGLVVEVTQVLEETEHEVEVDSSINDDNKNSGFDNYTVSFDPHEARSRNDAIIELIDLRVPHIANKLSNQEKLSIASVLLSSEDLESIPNEDTLIDANEEEYRLRSEANDLVKEVASELMKMADIPYSSQSFGRFMKHSWTCIKRVCGFPPNQSLDNISGIDNYRRVINACLGLRDSLQTKADGPWFDPLNYLSHYGR